MILAHSLGSVIALDSLIASSVWTGNTDVVLITMGSPLRRFFSRFFPDMVIPDDLNFSARLVANRVRSFSWLNCYRPFDQIGARLGLDHSIGIEISTRQFNRFISAHPNYWSDSIVRDKLLNAYSRMPTLVPRMEGPFSRSLRPDFPHDTARTAISKATLSALRYPLVVAPLMALAIASTSTYESSVEYRSYAARARSTGIPVKATFSYWRHETFVPESAYAAELNFREDLLRWSYTINDKTVSGEKADIDNISFERISYLIDAECVVGLVRDGCTARDSEWCSRSGIEARVLGDDPATFVVPRCLPHRGLADAIVNWGSRLASAVIGIAMFLAFSLVTAVPYIVILLGSPTLLKEGAGIMGTRRVPSQRSD